MLLTVFILVYAGMMLGGLPRLRVERSGIALLGAIVLVASGRVSLEQATGYLDLPTLVLLFAMMVLSAQLRLGGFYGASAARFAGARHAPTALLAGVVAIAGALAAVFTNDVIALAIAPVLLHSCRARGLSPLPFLLALAAATNVGSAATLIGNPQNILVGQALRLPFAAYSAVALVPTVLGLAVVWAVVAAVHRATLRPAGGGPAAPIAPDRPFNAWQSGKGLVLAGCVLVAFLFTDVPREGIALTAAGIVLLSREFHTREMLGLVDWELLVLFVGLFVVNGALQESGATALAIAHVTDAGVPLARPGGLFLGVAVLSNLVSNVPAVMLLLPVTDGVLGGAVLALSSTLAGNLLIVGSIANIIVVEQARRAGVAVGWREHARVGIPITVGTLALAAIGLWLAAPALR